MSLTSRQILISHTVENTHLLCTTTRLWTRNFRATLGLSRAYRNFRATFGLSRAYCNFSNKLSRKSDPHQNIIAQIIQFLPPRRAHTVLEATLFLQKFPETRNRNRYLFSGKNSETRAQGNRQSGGGLNSHVRARLPQAFLGSF